MSLSNGVYFDKQSGELEEFPSQLCSRNLILLSVLGVTGVEEEILTGNLLQASVAQFCSTTRPGK
jgi:hypothetical protein